MGQAESRQKLTSVTGNEDAQSYEVNSADQIPPGVAYEDELTTNSFCCVTKRTPTGFDNSRWKKLMIEHLESLEMSGWPKILSKCLKKFELGEFASVFQADVFWTYKNYQILGRKSFSIQSVLSQSGQGESFFENMPQRDQLNGENKSLLNVQQEKKNADDVVQGLLDNTHILEEKFYNSNQRETWINKSFNITVQDIPTTATNQNDSFTARKSTKRISTKDKHENSYRNSEYTRKHIEKYKNNTFVSQIPVVRTDDENNTAEDLYQKIMKYKIVTEIIEKHLKQKRNIFYHLMTQFSSYFMATYRPLVARAKNGEFTSIQTTEISEVATADLQQFIRVIFEGLCTFYRLDSLESGDAAKDSLFNRDNLLSFTTSMILTKEIHEIILEFYKLKEAELEQTYQNNLKQCKNLQPQDFGVPDEYCLNEKTACYFLEKGLVDKQYLLERNTPRYQPEVKVNSHFSICEEEETKMGQSGESNPQDSEKTVASTKEGQEPLQQTLEIYRTLATETRPYEDAIMMLSSLKHRTSPIHKLKAIVKVAELITKSIEKFYMRYGLLNNNKLDADQTLSIFLYIVTKSGLGDLTAHCRIIEKFSTNNVLNSVSGYYATTLEACVNCINSMKFADEASPNRLSLGFKEFVSSMRISVGRVSLNHSKESPVTTPIIEEIASE